MDSSFQSIDEDYYNFTYSKWEKILKNLTADNIEFFRKQLLRQCIKNSSFCDGWLKDVCIAYNVIHSYVSLAVCVFGTIANVLNIVVLTRKDMVSTPINRILTGLAVADMLVMLEYIPFNFYMSYEAAEKSFSYYGAVFLIFHVHFSQVLHTISIFLTLTLAIWRYMAIRHPQRSLILCTESRCKLAIICSYILPMFVCIPSYFLTSIARTNVMEDHKSYVLYHLDLGDTSFAYIFNFWAHAVVIKLLPCVILTVISYCLIQALYKVNKRKAALRSYNNGIQIQITDQPSNSTLNASNPLRYSQIKRRSCKAERRTERTTRMLIAVLFLFLITEFPQGILGLLSGIYGWCFYSQCYQNFGSLMDILALLNGAINFILYCSMSRQFRLTFEKLFKPKVLEKWRTKTSQTDVHSTFV